MKTSFLTTIVFSFLLHNTIGIQAQTPQAKLNQFDLEKQFLGTWQAINGNEITTVRCKLFYNGVETYFKTEKEGKIVVENKLLLGYDKKLDKLVECGIGSDDKCIAVYAAWFTSENKMEEVLLEDISKPADSIFRQIFEFKSSDAFILTYMNKNKITGTYSFKREK
jgi:hypothetical protein